jgi:hypothetical protein
VIQSHILAHYPLFLKAALLGLAVSAIAMPGVASWLALSYHLVWV